MDNPDINSPWDADAEAFDPMFCDPVTITHGGKKTTLNAAVFVSGTGDPLLDSSVETERDDITIVVRKTDWPYIQNLTRGDSIVRPNGKRYKLSAVECDEIMGWCLAAREV